MLNDDYYTNREDTPPWIKYKIFEFKTNVKMLEWVSSDKKNMALSDIVYEAMLYCLEQNIDSVVVATILTHENYSIDVIIKKSNFQTILTRYTSKLLDLERYEKLSEIKVQMEKYNLEV